jgi:hypothetical protein
MERERVAQDRLTRMVEAEAGLEAKVSTLQAESARLGAELRAVKEDMESCRRAEQDALADLEVCVCMCHLYVHVLSCELLRKIWNRVDALSRPL